MDNEQFDFDEWINNESAEELEVEEGHPIEQDENNPDEASYEAKIQRLEHIVSTLEKGDVSLEKSMELFQEGVDLANRCAKQLSNFENKIQKLMDSGERVDFAENSNDNQ